eukprot:CAMPEP_0173349466 /NCGR_PEP_ID=MMETSP1144-20121109/14328_1 /TAXON_ID=483371 /ORGANISM="non described non described, Strain CCMP2298" /LENGTH=213 /DNA_ID=CAMNT_0014297273 /DNA_START=302 /DNA_END=938 /DNA_ORIENTATION=-
MSSVVVPLFQCQIVGSAVESGGMVTEAAATEPLRPLVAVSGLHQPSLMSLDHRLEQQAHPVVRDASSELALQEGGEIRQKRGVLDLLELLPHHGRALAAHIPVGHRHPPEVDAVHELERDPGLHQISIFWSNRAVGEHDLVARRVVGAHDDLVLADADVLVGEGDADDMSEIVLEHQLLEALCGVLELLLGEAVDVAHGVEDVFGEADESCHV